MTAEHDYNDAMREIRELRERIDRLRAAILWALGEERGLNGAWFGDHKPRDTSQRPYWWRTELRALAGVDEQLTTAKEEG